MVKIWRFGVLGLLGCMGAIAVSINPTFAQLTPDNTLGIDKSVVIPINKDNDRIGGGAARGINLFHSFQDFNVGIGRGVYFANPQGITNIFSRVTGGNSSNIFGKLGVLGDANLFLLNPNGILFGKNASLDLQGSFLGTTANGVQFGNQGVFSATNPEAPPLLTINPSALFFSQINQNASIQNNSIAPAGKDPAGFNAVGLRVPDGKSLLLVGNNVSMDGGQLNAYAGRVELGGLAESGNVNLLFDRDNLKLGFPENVNRADVSLTNQARVYVQAAGGGDIAINAQNLEMSNSFMFAGIGTGLGDGSTKGGDININADAISLLNGAQIAAFTNGKGDAGNIFIAARDVISLDSGLIANVVLGRGVVANAGNINITTGSLNATNGAGIGSTIAGRGNAGNVRIEARDAVTFNGGSSLFSNVQTGAVGNGGNINITASSLSLTNGSRFAVNIGAASDNLSGGQGIGGSVNINVRDAFFISGRHSGIFASTGIGAVGRGGDITIKAGEIAVENSGTISSETYGKGDAGDITINTKNLIVRDSQLGSIVHGEGNAGTFKIIASDSVELSGEIPGNEKGFPGGIFAQLDVTGKGKGGNVYIETGRLSVSDGSKVQAATFGEGNAGSLFIRADEIDIFNTQRPRYYGTGIFSGVQLDPRTVKPPQGNGGDLRIETRNLTLRNGGEIGSSTSGKGNAGNIFITARNAIFLDAGSYIYNSVQRSNAVGNAGNIDITTGYLKIQNEAGIFAGTFGKGNGVKLDQL